MKFSKNYTHEITSTVSYINIPENKLLNKKSDSVLHLVLNGNGFKLMNYRIFTPEIEIDVQKSAVFKSGKAFFLTKEHRELLKTELDYNGEIKQMSTDTLRVLFDANLHKKILIQLEANISYASGYASKEGLVLVPDSVMVNGPAKLVEATTMVRALPIDLENVNKDMDLKIELDLESYPDDLQVLPNQVQGILKVNKFTEGTLSLPIQLINTPKNTRITIFPKTVNVIYRVSLEGYKAIKENDFKIIADFKNRDVTNAFIPLIIKKQPKLIQNVRLQEQQVQFVIVK